MRNTLVLSYPASFWSAKWRDALPSGNGEIGIGVYGGVHKETILLNHEKLWVDNSREPLPDISGSLSLVRQLLHEGKIAQAQDIMTDALKERGYGGKIAWPLPLGDFMIETPVRKGFEDYQRSLDMETGEIKVSFRDSGVSFCRRAFASRADRIAVISLESSSEHGLKGIALRMNIHDPDNARKAFEDKKIPLPTEIEAFSEGSYLYYSARYGESMDFGAVARIIAPAEYLCSERDTIQFSGGNHALILISLFCNSEQQEAFRIAKRSLSMLQGSYSDFLARHSELHKPLFLSATLSLDDPDPAQDDPRTNEDLLLEAYRKGSDSVLLEKMWSFGRYLLISSSRREGLPCPLLGLWHGDYKPMWSFHMLNENLQMIYWGALSGNMPDLLLCVFDYFEKMMDDFRENARKLFGCRGIYIPAVTTPYVGTIQCISRHILAWTAGAGWLAQHYFNYYLYTQDKKFLKERALPFMHEVADFYEDFFVIDENGFYESIPSVSPENSPGNFINLPQCPYPEVTVNATMDFAVAKELLRNLLAGAREMNLYQDEWKKWESMLDKIPPYQINSDGAACEWMSPMFTDHYEHRHLSHFYPVFPGNEITQDSDPELFHAFSVAVEKRLGLGISAQTAWSFAHLACVYARMKDGNAAMECLNNLLRSCVMNNFFTVHNDWRGMGIGLDMPRAPFQIDANMGITAAINDMLLLSAPACLDILPALPSSWKKGNVQGLRACGGIIVSIRWDMVCGFIAIQLTTGNDCMVKLSFPAALRHVSSEQTSVEHSGENTINVFLKSEHPISISAKLYSEDTALQSSQK